MPPWGTHGILALERNKDEKNVIFSIIPDLVWAYMESSHRQAHSSGSVRRAYRYSKYLDIDPAVPQNIEDHNIFDYYSDNHGDGLLDPFAEEIYDYLLTTKLYKNFEDVGNGTWQSIALKWGKKKTFKEMAEIFVDGGLELLIVDKYGTKHLELLNESAKELKDSRKRFVIAKAYHGVKPVTDQWMKSIYEFSERIYQVDFMKLTSIDGMLELFNQQLKNVVPSHNAKDNAIRFYGQAFADNIKDSTKRREVDTAYQMAMDTLKPKYEAILTELLKLRENAPKYYRLVPK